MEFNKQIFSSPASEYRDAPFWSWNGRTEEQELEKQMECFKQMGFGGVHIHPRTGMDTKYLSDEYMNLINVCINKAKELQMLVYLYDEDRWPSGFAGGFVTENPRYRARHLLFTKVPYDKKPGSSASEPFSATSHRTGNGTLIAVYDIVLDEKGNLSSYKKISKNDSASGEKWYAYLELAENSPWFNGFTNADLLNKEATEEFLKITHDKYFNRFGEHFGKLIPSVFTDEPQLAFNKMLSSPMSDDDVILSWTDDLPDTYKNSCGLDLLEGLPEIIWEKEIPSTFRYHYYKHISERFMSGFLHPYSEWCKNHNIKFTGHFLEGTPTAQTTSVGDTMLMYDAEDIPGVDILVDNTEARFHAKLMQSVAQQKGLKQMLCEIYGVNNWNFEFKDYLFQGNWAAACGVNLRAHHLSMYTMEGEGKRDYPGSIGYQAPWWERYKTIEDYFARVNYILQLGERIVKVGVINPVESEWIVCGNNEQTEYAKMQIDDNFKNITDWLTLSGVDFDFISEALISKYYSSDNAAVGKMNYNVIIVPGCISLRDTTAKMLCEMADKGAKIIIAGSLPSSCDGRKKDYSYLADKAEIIAFSKAEILRSVEPYRILSMRESSGNMTKDLLHQIRCDGDDIYLFAASVVKPTAGKTSGRNITFSLKGSYEVEKANLFEGTFEKLNSEVKDGNTVVCCPFYDFGSVLLRFSKKAEASVKELPVFNTAVKYEITDVLLSEPNVMVLDMGTWQLGDGKIMPCEEILKADNKVRKILGLEQRRDVMTQPWKIEKEYLNTHFTFTATFESEIEYEGTLLALENIEDTVIMFNNEAVPSVPCGYYADRCIHTVKLPAIKKDKNTLTAIINYNTKTNVEAFYLLGYFGVRVNGMKKTLTDFDKDLFFGDVTKAGLPFYGGNITYKLCVQSQKALCVKVPHYIGAVVTVSENNTACDLMAPPYTAYLPAADCKKREVLVTLYGTRYNTFAALHNCDETNRLKKSHPNSWRVEGNIWSDEYQIKPFGILKSPEIYE